MDELSYKEFLAQFPSEQARDIERVAARWREEGHTHMVCFQNQDLSSSHMGEATCMVVGPNATYKSVEECEGKHLFDLPSVRQYPVSWTLL